MSRSQVTAPVADPDTHWNPCGVLTWTTDFGLHDAYVGTMHGVVLGLFPAARQVDLCHGIPAQDLAAAALQLRHAWSYFPRGSVHVALVDPGVGSSRAVLAALQNGHAFVAPDNGLLSGVLDPERAQVFEVDPELFGLPKPSHTFHGRDIFAPLAAAMASGADPRQFGTLSTGWLAAETSLDRQRSPVHEHAGFDALVVLTDRFGNAITDLEPGAHGLDLREYEVSVAGQVIPLVDTYGQVDPGSPLALVDSWGHLEIAVRDGDAAQSLGLARGTPVTLRRCR